MICLAYLSLNTLLEAPAFPIDLSHTAIACPDQMTPSLRNEKVVLLEVHPRHRYPRVVPSN